MGFKRKFKHQCTFEEVELYSKKQAQPSAKSMGKIWWPVENNINIWCIQPDKLLGSVGSILEKDMVICRFWSKSTVLLGTWPHCADSTNTFPLKVSQLQYADCCTGAGVQRREAMGEGMPEKKQKIFPCTRQGSLPDILPSSTGGKNKAPRMKETCPCSHN